MRTWVCVCVPGEEEEEEGAGAGPAGAEGAAEAEALADDHEDGLAEEEEEQGADAVAGGDVGVVHAVVVGVLRVRHHLSLRSQIRFEQDGRGGEGGRGSVSPCGGAARRRLRGRRR